MKILIKLTLILFTLSSCSLLGTKTLYKKTSNSKIQRIGILNICSEDEVNKIFPGTNEIYTLDLLEAISKYSQNKTYGVQLNSPCYLDFKTITKLCKLQKLDGLIISELKFKNKTKNRSDTEIKMQLYDSVGGLILSISHGTYWGNSYWMTPKFDKSIHDATNGAAKRLIKLLQQQNQTSNKI